jgi:hypothetical protein
VVRALRSLFLALTASLAITGFAQQSLDRAPGADQADYEHTRANIATLREQLAVRYLAAADQPSSCEVIDAARRLFAAAVVDSLAPHWYGTAWDFHGTSAMPGEGSIACGYLVSTLLQHVGLRVKRYRLAQQAAERIVLSLSSPRHLRRFSNAPLARVVDDVRAWGPGLYVVGLDFHVGFLWQEDDGVWFIHASYCDPPAVLREEALTSVILASSRYLVVGKISADDELLRKWLLQERVATMVD